MSPFYLIFRNQDGSDNPSVLLYMGTILPKNFKEIDDINFDEDDYNEQLKLYFNFLPEMRQTFENEYKNEMYYISEYEMKNGGCIVQNKLVGFNAEPNLIENNNIFKGNVEEIKSYLNLRSLLVMMCWIQSKQKRIPQELIRYLNEFL